MLCSEHVLERRKFERILGALGGGCPPSAPYLRPSDSVQAEELTAWDEELGAAKLDQHHYRRELSRHLDRGHGSYILKNPVAAKVVQDALIFHHGRLYDPHERAVLHNHGHALLSPNDGVGLDRLMHANKSYTSTKIHQTLGGKGRLWQRGVLRSPDTR